MLDLGAVAKADIPALIAEIKKLRQHEKLLVKALSYYAEEEVYTWLPYRHSCRGPTRYTAPRIIADGGTMAREALVEFGDEDANA